MEKTIIRSDNHVTIDGWMINELELSGSELIVYGLIWGFSQTENQWCTASQAYIARWANITTRGLIKILNRLEEKGFLIREKNTCKKGYECKYRAVRPSIEEQNSDVNKVHIRCEQSSYPEVNKVHIRCEQSSHNNIEDNIDNNIEDIKENIIKENSESEADFVPKSSEPKKKREKFIKPTVEEIKAYCQERKNSIDAEYFFDHYESKGWKVGKNPMKDWKAAVRNWERNEYGNGYSYGKRGSDPFDVRNQYWDENDPTVH